MDNRAEKADEFLKANIRNMVSIAEHKHYPKYSFFLDNRQKYLADAVLKELKCSTYAYFGGYEQAERVMLGVYPDYLGEENLEFPVTVLKFTYRREYPLSHRDFLGALMSLQVKREVVGDILVGEGCTYVPVYGDIADYIISNCTKIGNVGVSISVAMEAPVPSQAKFQLIEGTVSSLRLDCMIALITRYSRSKSRETVLSGLVQVNHRESLSPDLILKPDDVITIRGFGKHILLPEMHETKKGRFHVSIHKYV